MLPGHVQSPSLPITSHLAIISFNGNTGNSLLKAVTSVRSSLTSIFATDLDCSLKGQLNQSDTEMLEEQTKWESMEVDYSADMQPVITGSTPAPNNKVIYICA